MKNERMKAYSHTAMQRRKEEELKAFGQAASQQRLSFIGSRYSTLPQCGSDASVVCRQSAKLHRSIIHCNIEKIVGIQPSGMVQPEAASQLVRVE